VLTQTASCQHAVMIGLKSGTVSERK